MEGFYHCKFYSSFLEQALWNLNKMETTFLPPMHQTAYHKNWVLQGSDKITATDFMQPQCSYQDDCFPFLDEISQMNIVTD